ncbi:MAG: lamin tail domain-containing protein [Thermoplasmata archaeon]|nr:MAG: lamin tail domain-containing protein [Thermoplasmata archaeon]
MNEKVKKMLATTLILWMVFAGLAVVEWNMDNALGHVAESAGDPLQLYSYYNPTAFTDINLDGDISGAGDPTEWDAAYVREIQLYDFEPLEPDYLSGYLLTQNDDNFLYIGVVYQSGSTAADNECRIYFDEGDLAGRYDGSHDDDLTDGNENYVGSRRDASNQVDGYWNGGWISDPDIALDWMLGRGWGNSYLRWEWRIPLDGKEDTGLTGSDLNIVRDDELGIFVEIWESTENEWFYWELTGNNPMDFTRYADLKMGLMTKDRSFYSTYSQITPTIDGDITNDFGWSDCYQRDIVLSNFKGTTLDATIFINQDPNIIIPTGYINIGLIIYDDDNNPQDYTRLYFEEGSGAPFGPRNGVLSGAPAPLGPEYEHYEQVTSQGIYTEGWFDAATGVWANDITAPDDFDDGNADALYYNPSGVEDDRYEFEFLVPYIPGSAELNDGDFDLWIANHDLIGMLIRFYDFDMPAGEQDFYWDRTVNVDKVKTQGTAGSLFIAPSWAYLQTGCAWVRLVSPVDGSTVIGNEYNFRIDADDEDAAIGDDINYVGFQVEGESTWTSLSQRFAGSSIFETTWDTTKYDNGLYDLRIVVQDNDGVTMWRTISVAIVNPTSIAPPTGVAIISPAPGTISGTQIITVTAVNADRVELYVDGEYVNDMAPTGNPDEYSYTLDTKNYDDGYHQLRARAINGAGESSGYETYTFDNWDDLLSVNLLRPSAGEMLSGVYTVYVDFEDDDQDNLAYPGPGYVELYVDGVLTVVEYTEIEWPGDNWGYEVTLDTVWFMDGSHTIKTLVYDPEGNSLADTVLVNFVNEPSLQIMQPATGEVISGTSYPLTIKATDPNGDSISDDIINPQYRVDYGMWYDMANTLSIGHVVISEVMYEHSIANAEWVELFNPQDVDVSLTGLSLWDDAGNFFTFPGGATIPAYGTIVVAINALAFESVYGYTPDYDSGLLGERLQNTGDWVDFAGGSDYVSWEGAGLGWGLFATSGRSIQRNPYVDTDSESDWLSDVSTVTPCVAAPVFYTGNFDTTTLSDGPHVIEFQVTDITGAVATRSVNVIVDNILLDSIIITDPTPGEIIKNMYTVTVDPFPESEAQYAELYVDDAFAAFDGALDVSGNFEFSLLTTGYPDGSHNLKIMIYDLYDNSIVNTTSVLIQNEPSLYVVSPKANEVIRGVYEVNISAVDTDGILDDESPRPRYRLDGGTTWYDLDLLAGTSNYISDAGEFDTTLLNEGSHTIEFEVMDSGPYGITTMKSVDIIVDNSRPTGFPVLPSLGQNIEGTYTFSIMANDNLDVDHVDITFNNVGGSDIWNIGTKRATYNSFTGYYELTVVTTIYTDGAAQITVNIYDKAGNVNDPGSPIILDYFIDNNEPILSILQPGDDEYVSGSSSVITASATDGPFTPIVECKIDTGSWNPMGGGPVNWNANWDTTLYKAGEHTITVRARDILNHISSQTVNVIVDNNNPICAILSPVFGEYTQGTLTIKVHASDSVGIDHVNVTVFGTTATTTYNPGTGYYEYIRSTTSYSDGVYDITATAYDFSKKAISDGPITFYVDNTEPVLTILQPLYGEYVSGAYPIWANANDVFLDTVEYKIDSTNWVAMTPSAPWTGSWDTTNFADGEHTLTIRAIDNASHIVENSIVVWVDNNQPSLTLRSPIPNEFIGGMYTFQVASMDAVGIDYIEIDVFGIIQIMSYNPLTGYYEYTVNTYTQTDGTYDVTITAYDLSGKSASVGPRSFNVDNNAPLLIIDDPTDGQYIFGNYGLSITSTDTFISEVEYKIDTTEWIALTGPAPTWTGQLNTSQYTDGEHTLTIRSYDGAGHVTQQSVEVIVDNTDPTVSISMPILNQYIDGVFTFQIAAEDSPSVDFIGIDYVEITVFGDTHYTTFNAQTGYYEYTISTYSLVDGVYNITAWVHDLSGRSLSAGPLDFNVDNNAPLLVMNHPQNGEFVEGDYSLNVSVSDAFILSVEYRIDMTNWLAMGPGSGSFWEALWNTSLEVDGEHRIYIRALDYSGKMTQQYVDIYVDNFAPTCDIVSPAYNQYIQGIFTFQIAAVDSVGIDYVSVNVYDMVFNATYNMQSGYFEFPLDTKLEPEDNVRNVSAWAYDLSGKSASDGPVDFMVDNNPPVLNIIYPENEDYISSEIYVNISALDAFIGPQEYSVDDRGWDPIVVPWNTTAITDGWHTLSIRVFDMIGHKTQQTINVYVDNIAPKCSIISPVWDQFVENIYTFEISATDLVGIDYVSIDVFDMTVEIPYNSETGYYEYSIDTRTVDDGTHDILATAYDKSGKSSNLDSITFRVDNTPPDLTLLYPLNGEYVKEEIVIEVLVNDTFDCTVKYTVDDSGWTQIEDAFNTTLVSDNEHLITVRATDEAGHVTERTVTVIVDNIAPELIILEPKNGTHVSDEMLLNVYAGGGVQKVRVSIDDGMRTDMVSLGINSPYEITFDTTELEDGYHTIYVNSIDFTGQESDRECQVFVDNSGPEIIVVKPKSFKNQQGNIYWEINATDDTGVAGVYIKFDSGEWRAMLYDNYTCNYTFGWLTTEDDNRRYDYEIKTVDTLGNEELIRGKIKVKNPMNVWRAFQDNIPGIGFLFLIFFIVLCFVLLKVGKLQSWYREEKKAPKPHAEGEKKGRLRRVFARKRKGTPSVAEAADLQTAEEIVHEIEDIEGGPIPVVQAKQIPPPPPPSMGKKSLMESIDDIEITAEEPPAPKAPPAPKTTAIPPKAASTISEMEAIAVKKPETAEGKKVIPGEKKKLKKKRFKRKVLIKKDE